MSINISELIWTILCFFALLLILKKLLFTPLLTFMDARRARIDAGLAAARDAQQAQEQSAGECAAALRHSSAQAKQILLEAAAADQQAHARLLGEARRNAAASMLDARGRLRGEQDKTRRELDGCMPELVAVLAGTLLDGQPLEGQDALIQRCVDAAGAP